MMEHTIRWGLFDHIIKVAVVGAGGTRSQIMTGLARLHHAMVELGHPGGLSVPLYDDDVVVSESNVARQAFYHGDIGNFKAPVVINRINLGFGLNWESEFEKVTSETDLADVDLIVGCVDTRKARLAIFDAASNGS
ncbi:PRTRC system ThiF family protein [Undibacterium sp. Di27W]|uniref:PRTRC system ThiF family protein n=1 Tax=Undibacterium sp. Di27W TaxID=3413036 RepID=UPI003BF453C2